MIVIGEDRSQPERVRLTVLNPNNIDKIAAETGRSIHDLWTQYNLARRNNEFVYFYSEDVRFRSEFDDEPAS